MFTEGLDKNALRWVREKDLAFSNSNMRPRIDPIIGTRGNGGRGFVLPPPSKFRSGHLAENAIPISTTIPIDVDDSGSNSDNDVGTESEEEVYGGRYSLDSSPQDHRVRVPNGAAHRNENLAQRQPRYGSDYTYSEVSSSRETLVGRHGFPGERLTRGIGKYPIRLNGYTEDESSDSAASSEFSTTQVGSINGTVPPTRAYVSKGYASSVHSSLNKESAAEKDSFSTNQQNGRLFDDDDVPSAPPICTSAQEIRQASEEISDSRERATPFKAGSREFSTTKDSSNFKHVTEDKEDNIKKSPDQVARTTADSEAAASSGSHPARIPNFHASALGPWHAVVAYDACVRLCLHAWAIQCMEAPRFLENECALLRDAFGLRKVLLQSEDEIMMKRTSDISREGVAPKPKKVIGKMKVQVRKIKVALDAPTGCSISSLRKPSIKLESVRHHFSSLQLTLASGWQTLKKVRFVPRIPANGSLARQSLAYVHASTRYIQQVSGLLKTGVTTLRNSSSSYEVVQETYSCLLRLKSSAEEDAIKMQPGSGETHLFFPDSVGDDLIVEVQDSKGNHFGRVLVQVASIADDPADKLRWCSVYHEPGHELVGKMQLYINYSTSSDENSHLKCGSVAETVAYDLVLEVAMKVQHFQQRNLLLHDPWRWLLKEFASYYGVSDVYTKLRYLSYIMDVATPTAECLSLVLELLAPVVNGHQKTTLSHQENRILGETKDQIEQILTLVFENYKSLDESSLSGIMDVFRPASGVPAPALEPAVRLYNLLHDILTPEAQTTLCHYFQVAAKKRSRRHMAETDEYVTSNNEGNLMDSVTLSTAYQKMKSLCVNIKNEIFTDIEIRNRNILPICVDLPNLSASIYSTELCSRLRAFLIACPPAGPSPPVAELVIATSDFQRDLISRNISPVKGGVDAKELFHLYILVWIQDKRLSLLESCKLDKVKWSGVRTQHSTTPFIDDMYERVKETLTDYEVIICRWPEYAVVLENAIADIEKAIVEALDKQYADVLSPLKENLNPKKFGLKYVQKLTKRSVCSYTVPDELGILLNSMKRMLDILRPKVEHQFKSWGSCLPGGGNSVPGERLSEVTVMLRTKFRNYLQAVVEKLTENTKLQNTTKLKKILQDSKETVVESDVRARMQPLKDQLANTISHLHTIFQTQVFIAICRGYWDRMGQEVLSFMENRKENRSWYKGSRIATSVLEDTFATQMQQLLGNALQEKDLELPRSIMEVRSMLCKDTPNHKDNMFYY
ncbi:Pesticidal crystal cry8Ba protein [Quillaja saponaria]|uniref:Pesticidal crystal cry8Ba protein n=1 Tax=Quillaja saponaria TaxID=32244 RepID=A0AAD7LJB5_QUISA|nr:Pesticidal crystal cry8Ba protein [Quillaja saponaria]